MQPEQGTRIVALGFSPGQEPVVLEPQTDIAGQITHFTHMGLERRIPVTIGAFHDWYRVWEEGRHEHAESIVGMHGPIVLIAAELHSPGFFEFLGALAPLETIPKYGSIT